MIQGLDHARHDEVVVYYHCFFLSLSHSFGLVFESGRPLRNSAALLHVRLNEANFMEIELRKVRAIIKRGGVT